ncbi:MAG: hypothetical protein ACI80S_000878 [Pseudohongiellaceae bacterium]|mgnify:CR=1 FL=1
MDIKGSIFEHTSVRLLAPSSIGFLFYGSWAFWVNYEAGQTLAFKAALTQGGFSFVMTLVLALLIEELFLHFKAWAFYLFVIGLITCSFLLLTSWALNYFAGTPNILLTILPGAVVSSLYTMIYIQGLNKLAKYNKVEVL